MKKLLIALSLIATTAQAQTVPNLPQGCYVSADNPTQCFDSTPFNLDILGSLEANQARYGNAMGITLWIYKQMNDFTLGYGDELMATSQALTSSEQKLSAKQKTIKKLRHLCGKKCKGVK